MVSLGYISMACCLMFTQLNLPSCTGRQLLVDSPPPHSIAHRHLSLSLNPLTPRLPFTAQGIATLLDAEKEAAQIVAKARDCMCNYPPSLLSPLSSLSL
jgi:hypothetical protein